LVFLVDGVLKFQTLVDYFGSYALVEITLLLFIPAEMGYGKFFVGQSGRAERSQPGIPGGSTLIFEIELLGIA